MVDQETGRSVLVTGASGGIGRAVVSSLLAAGLRVWAAVRTEEAALRLRREHGGEVRLVIFDLTDPDAVAAAADAVIADGPLYGLINNAGAALPGPLEYVPIAQFQRQLDVNLTGQLRVTQAMLPALRAGATEWGAARIVMMGSLDARIVGPLFGPYAASKHALVGLSDALRTELHPARITVTLIEPGVIATPIWERGTAVLGQLQPGLPDRGGPYRSIMNFAQRYVSRLSGHGSSPDRVAHAVLDSLIRPSAPPRRVVGIDARIVTGLLAILPARVIYRLTALPRLGSARDQPG